MFDICILSLPLLDFIDPHVNISMHDVLPTKLIVFVLERTGKVKVEETDSLFSWLIFTYSLGVVSGFLAHRDRTLWWLGQN